MKSVIRYVAEDSAEFATEDACVKYEALVKEIKAIVGRLKPKSSNMLRDQFVQQSGPVLLSVQRDLCLIYGRERSDMCDEHVEFAANATVPVGMSMMGRLIDDSGIGAGLNSAWHRIMCTDNLFREWEQPYYALEANKGRWPKDEK